MRGSVCLEMKERRDIQTFRSGRIKKQRKVRYVAAR